MYCSRCGAHMGDSLKFCPHCGHHVAKSDERADGIPPLAPQGIEGLMRTANDALVRIGGRYSFLRMFGSAYSEDTHVADKTRVLGAAYLVLALVILVLPCYPKGNGFSVETNLSIVQLVLMLFNILGSAFGKAGEIRSEAQMLDSATGNDYVAQLNQSLALLVVQALIACFIIVLPVLLLALNARSCCRGRRCKGSGVVVTFFSVASFLSISAGYGLRLFGSASGSGLMLSYLVLVICVICFVWRRRIYRKVGLL